MTIAKGCPRCPETYPHQALGSRWEGQSLGTLLPPTPHVPYLALLGPAGAVTSFLTLEGDVFGINFFGSLLGAGRREQRSICSLTYHPCDSGPVCACAETVDR